jgi:HCOMODA/2-hydroxy-3-carboxy-muconic semialdehyde decarboxylase
MNRVVIALGLLLALQAPKALQALQAPQAPPTREQQIEDLVAANRVLAQYEIVDGYGHVTVRSAANPNRYFISRSLAPAQVTAADIMEFDLDSNAVNETRGRVSYQERFIHGELYKARPDVMSVVHMHAPAVIPFSNSNVPLRPMFHMSAFIAQGIPVFEIRDVAGMTDMLISNANLGRALAKTVGAQPAALMRGHGAAIVGPTLAVAVARSVYLAQNAAMQAQAIALGGPIKYLDPEEAKKVGDQGGYLRSWDLWKAEAQARMGTSAAR